MNLFQELCDPDPFKHTTLSLSQLQITEVNESSPNFASNVKWNLAN